MKRKLNNRRRLRPQLVTAGWRPDGIKIMAIIYKMMCLPCGHMYGIPNVSRNASSKAPLCLPMQKTLCSFQVHTSLATYLCVIAHEKLRVGKFINRAEGTGRRAQCLWDWVDFFGALQRRASSIGTTALNSRRRMMHWNGYALLHKERLVSALRRRMDALVQRSDAFESRMRFYFQMYKEHHKREEEITKAKQALDRKKKLAEKAAAKAKKKGEKEAEKVPEKKLKHKEKKDEKKMQASGTVDVPEEEMVEDVAEEPEEEKVEVKDKPTTKTTERVRVRSRSNSGKGTDSISKVILKRKKSNNYMY
ncbi:proton pump-interactor 1-like protein [Tanacetum coccineum]